MNAKRQFSCFQTVFLLILLWESFSGRPLVHAQDALVDRVAQLLEKLDSSEVKDVESAEQALLRLGPRILPLLPKSESGEAISGKGERLKALIKILNERQMQNLSASTVTIKGRSIRLTEALKELQQQSGNTVVDLREQLGQESTNPSMDLEIENQSFFKALDTITKKAALEQSYYTAENAIGLMNGAVMAPVSDSTAESDFVQYLEAFRIRLSRIGITREYAANRTNHVANLQLELVWEPRLRPLMIKLKSDQILAKDDKGRELKYQVSGESMELSIRSENPIVDVNLAMDAPARDASEIATLEIVAELTLPTSKNVLQIANMTDQGKQVKVGDASLRIMGFEAEPPVWKVTAELVSPSPEGAESIDSYRQSNIIPQVFLTKADGARVPLNGGFSSSGGAGQNTMIYEFLFVDIPGQPSDHGLLVETPGKLKTVPLKWKFENIPLP